jgi:hypothetical protein
MFEFLSLLHGRLVFRFEACEHPGRRLGVDQLDDPVLVGHDYLHRADYELQPKI